MKPLVGLSVGFFWPLPHPPLYAEPARLVEMGLLEEQREEGGRRRRTYSITDAGMEELKDWLADPETPPIEMRDTGTLKLFFGNLAGPENVRKLAEKQVEANQQLIDEHRRLHEMFADLTGLESQPATPRL